jgi:EAL and modified HD-GYP domain-containing signal transduction protein
VHIEAQRRRPAIAESQVHVGRQEIYDREGRVVGYEMLFRNTATAPSASGSDDSATSSVIVNTFAEFGLDELVSGGLAFLNLTRSFLVDELPLPFGPQNVVLEVLETIDVDDEVVAGVRRLAAAGYAIALDDFRWRPGLEPLLQVARYVKLDVLGADRTEIQATMASCRPFGVRFVAERVEDAATLEWCRTVGFEFFQGYHLRRPQVLSIESISPNHASSLNLLTRLSDPDVNVDDVEELVRLDAVLSYRLLRIANSAGAGLRRSIASVRDAVMMVGLDRLRAWLVLIALADVTGSGDDKLAPIVVRARACELLAQRVGTRGDTAFTLGLLHGLADLLGVSVDELTERLQLAGTALAQAAADPESPLHVVLGAVLAHEQLDLEALAASGFDAFEVSRAYLDALGWSLQTCAAVNAD